MDKRCWLWLLLALLFSPGTATAQLSRHAPPPSGKESHHQLPGELDLDSAQEMMTKRLRELRELHQLQDQVQELLKDEQFRKQIEKLSKSDLQQMREKLLKGEGLSQDPKWNKLLEQARARQKLNLDILRRWAERAERKQPSSESGEMTPDNAAKATPTPPTSPPLGPSSPPPSQPTPSEPSPSMIDRLQEETTTWLMENLAGLSGDMLQSLTEMADKQGNTALAEMLRSVPQSDFSGLNVSDHPLVPALRQGTLSRYLSNAGDFFQRQSGVWDKLGSLFNKAPLPSLPNVGRPSVSMRTPSTAESDGWLPVVLCLLMLGLIVLFICKRGFGPKDQAGSGADAEWRLGSWPVPPGAVSTRQDVIRAFEYLALLCFGPAAAACHHRQLAERLASDNPNRRQAAEMLAWLYEQARYAPAGEALSQEQLSDARHALCSLAGVTSA
jgi:hypothetical protein